MKSKAIGGSSNENKKIRVIHYGLGPIGLATAKLILTKPDMEIVGAVYIAKL